MNKLGIQNPQTGLERRAFQDRLDQLGLKSAPDGSIDPKSAEGLRHGNLKGLDALQAVLDPSGKLDADGAAKLTKARTLVGIDVGRTASIDKKQSDAVRSIAMSIDGLSSTLAKALPGLEAARDRTNREGAVLAQKGGAERGAVDLDALSKIDRQLQALDKAWNGSALSTPAIGNIDPAAIRAVADSLGKLGETNADFIKAASGLRVAVLDLEPQGRLAKLGLNWIANTVSGPLNQLVELQRLVALTATKVASPTSSASTVQQKPASPAEQKPASLADQAKAAANDLASGIFGRDGVQALSDSLVRLTSETKHDLPTLKAGFDKAIMKTFLVQRSGAASTILDMIDQIRREADLERAVMSNDDAPVRAKKAAAGDLYATLGVTSSATSDELKAAYRKLARENHPDRNPGDANAAAQMQAINVANDTLSDASKRSSYDRKNPTAGKGYAARFDLPPPPAPREKAPANTVDERADQLMTDHGALIRLVSNVAHEHPSDKKAFLARLDAVLEDPMLIVNLASERLALPAPQT
jgi:hypothetical protein